MDARVASAVSNWAPRFTTNGVAVADFQRVTGGLERWDDWCSAWSAAATVHEDLGREALARGPDPLGGRAPVHARRSTTTSASSSSSSTRTQMREAHGHAVACLTDALPYLDPPGERIEIPFEGSRLVGILRGRPAPGRTRSWS